MRKRRLQITREEKGIFIMVVLLLVNIVSHLYHPAYRFYRDYCSALDRRFEDFRKEVQNDFVPSVALFASNILHRADSPISFFSPRSSPVVSSSSPITSRSTDVRQSELVGRFFSFCGRSYVDYCGNFLTVGDDLDGTSIMSISPLCVKTSRQTYYLKNDNLKGGVLNVSASD